ncbi:integrase core domain-containing protein [Streptomyces griseus]|uniref:integrase core domain-containing protein n=1 Tax=Streptomyces griseus TaxID=1911 RepID=UPI0033B1B905
MGRYRYPRGGFPVRRRPGARGRLAFVGSVADAYDNAIGEALNGTFKPELIEMRSPWKDVDQVERATLQRITRHNEDRLHSALDHVPPDEYEEAFRRSQEQPPQSPEAASPDSARPGLAHVGPETRSSERYRGSPPDRVVSVLWERAASKLSATATALVG